MSRNIQVTKQSTSESIRNTEGGKLIFAAYQNQSFAFLIQHDRLIAAQEFSMQESTIGAIYIGRIRKVAKNIDAYFVEIANDEICFLPMKEVYSAMPLKEGDELPVQVVREAQKTKQATVTTRISLSNDFIALSVGSTKVGYSNKLSAEKKKEINEWLTEAELIDKNGRFISADIRNDVTGIYQSKDTLPAYGAVIRTQAGECSKEDFLQNVLSLHTEFVTLLQNAKYRPRFSCIRKAPAGTEMIFDQLVYPYEFDEIVTDNAELFKSLEPICIRKFPEKKLRLYEDTQFPLTKLYSLHSKMETALERRVWLKSGGYLVIDPTEALTVIDVNSGKYEAKKATAVDTAWLINKEAAEEIALQLRLRNLSGMILIDFINMTEAGKSEELLNYLRRLVQKDKLKTIVHDITALGLVEITRRKQYKTLKEQIIWLKDPL